MRVVIYLQLQVSRIFLFGSKMIHPHLKCFISEFMRIVFVEFRVSYWNKATVILGMNNYHILSKIYIICTHTHKT